jgi:cyclopropane fatty-acyl-phospholipid synthase-like methyltransferase
MVEKSEFWQEFWKSRSDPLHSASTSEYYERMALELGLLIDVKDNMHVYEMACGSGTFYRRLGFDRTHYVGVDYSPSMIETFKRLEPNVNVSVADVRTFSPSTNVDLVYSNGMLQYLSMADAEKLIEQSAKVLNPGGSIVHAAVPWKALRWQLFSGAFGERPRNPLKASAIYLAEITRLKPSLGTWFAPAKLRKFGQDHGLSVTFFGSHYYPYRFHVKMTKRGA